MSYAKEVLKVDSPSRHGSRLHCISQYIILPELYIYKTYTHIKFGENHNFFYFKMMIVELISCKSKA